METENLMQREIKITWYRTPVERSIMSGLMKKNDRKGLLQAVMQLALFALTASFTWWVSQQITWSNGIWSVPLLFLGIFLHGTFCNFLGGVAVHELCHKTAFQNQRLNDFFLHVFSFLSWYDHVGLRLSHVKHHQVTVHHGLDGEIILPQKLDWSALKDGENTLPEMKNWKFFLLLFWRFVPIPNPVACWYRIRQWTGYSLGNLDGLGMFAGGEWWKDQILPAEKKDLRQRHRNWARILFCGHLALALVFILSGNWILLVLITGANTYCDWLGSLCGLPQHLGMGPDVPDFRLCCRTYTCNRFLGFLYWNMQYHVEHHMFPAVPFYNLPALRKAISHDLPPATHGLWATWKEIIAVLQKQRELPGWHYVPKVVASGVAA